MCVYFLFIICGLMTCVQSELGDRLNIVFSRDVTVVDSAQNTN